MATPNVLRIPQVIGRSKKRGKSDTERLAMAAIRTERRVAKRQKSKARR